LTQSDFNPLNAGCGVYMKTRSSEGETTSGWIWKVM